MKLGYTVALKFLPSSMTDNARHLELMLSEVRLARQVSSPYVCRVHDIVEADGLRFLSIEYVDGENLAGLLRRIRRLPADSTQEVAWQTCEGLGAAHAINGLLG
jgi:eukaryotic-like serine/threonine-protein kinase